MIDDTLAALADPTRRAVIERLRAEPLPSGELARALATSAPAMSRHLKVLRRAGLVATDEREDDARVRVYHLRKEPFDELRRWVEEVEAFWTAELQAFADHVERTRGEKG